MRITFGGKKGGLGKTVAAAHVGSLLAQNERTLIIDADPNGSLLSWSEEAGESFPASVVAWPTRDLAKRVRDVQDDWQHIVIDTGRAASDDDPILRQALQVSDVLVLPTAPALIEVRSIAKVLDLVDEIEALHHVDAYVLLNRVRAGTTSAWKAREGLVAAGLPLMKAQVGLREIYTQSWGTTITDFGEWRYVTEEIAAGVRV